MNFLNNAFNQIKYHILSRIFLQIMIISKENIQLFDKLDLKMIKMHSMIIILSFWYYSKSSSCKLQKWKFKINLS